MCFDPSSSHERQDTSGALASRTDVALYEGPIPTGAHSMCVKLEFQGNGNERFRGYHFTELSAHDFSTVDGAALNVTVRGWEKGGAETPLERRPQIEWREIAPPSPDSGGVDRKPGRDGGAYEL